MADVRTGKLRERVDIYETVQLGTEYGGTTTSNILYWPTWAKIEALSSSKTLQANQERLDKAYIVTVRYRKDKDVTKRLKIFYRGKWLNLNYIDDDEVMQEYVQFRGTYRETTGGTDTIVNSLEIEEDKPINVNSSGW